MSSLSISLPKKFSDAQFIGDLMNLFERRKVKCGDASSFTSFTSELASNNKLRSDLFTLCTAISHMAAEDLSGEELLVLVTRALSGTGVAKGSAVPEIPAEMRKAFLEGYAAWNNRASAAIDEPSVWPPPRKGMPADEMTAAAEEGSEPAAAKSPVEGGRTIQEALEIARERSPNGLLVSPRSSAPGPNIEHLTISELKKLLDEIEHRVSRIGPQLGQVVPSVGGDPEPAARPSRAGNGMFEPLAPAAEPAREEILRALRGAVLPFESAARPALAVAPAPPPLEPRGEFDEAAFLKRHPYLKPERAALAAASAAATPAIASAIPVGSIPAAATLPSAPAPLPVALPDPVKAENVTPVAPVAAAPADATAIPTAAALALAQPLQARAEVIPPASVPGTVIQTDAWYPPASGHVHIRVKIGSILAVAGFFVIAGCLSGIFVYQSMHPKTIDDFPSLRTPAPGSANTPDSQVVLAVPDSVEEVPNSPRSLREGGTAVKPPKGRAAIQARPPVAVWPPSNALASRDTISEAVASQAVGTGAASRHTSPISVPATTMIGYAVYSPKPAYPAEQAKGISGTVQLEVFISKRGNVTSARAVSGPPELRRAAEQAVEEWRFRPYFVDGDPTEVITTVGFFFNGR